MHKHLSVCCIRCELEPTSAEIGEAFYGHEKKVHLILRNIGQVTANFQFMPLPGAMFGDDKDKNFRTAPRWATVEPEQVRAWFQGSGQGPLHVNKRPCSQFALFEGMPLGSPVQYLVSHLIDAERCSLFFSCLHQGRGRCVSTACPAANLLYRG
jgi:hypothetical protein